MLKAWKVAIETCSLPVGSTSSDGPWLVWLLFLVLWSIMPTPVHILFRLTRIWTARRHRISVPDADATMFGRNSRVAETSSYWLHLTWDVCVRLESLTY